MLFQKWRNKTVKSIIIIIDNPSTGSPYEKRISMIL